MATVTSGTTRHVTLRKGLLILETLAAEAREFSVTELAERIGLGRSQTCEMLATLVETGYVLRNPHTRRYRIGLRTVELSSDILSRLEVRRVGMTYLFELMQQTGAHTVLGVPHRGGVLILEACYPEGLYNPTHPHFGALLSMGNSALGRALLAHLPEEERQRLCSAEELAELTPLLAEAQRTGLAPHIGYEEGKPVSMAYGAAIRDAEGEIVALLGCRIDWQAWEQGDQDLFRHRVLTTVQGLSRALGYVPSS
ncbi:MAG: helix-turn-helix domain-containing protein [candidate division WS1 bacterium]|nr:helix-turn-helix domain-containing protein [candidate division WS1 bacterium]